MANLLNFLIENYHLPIFTAFLIGVLTSISPCPLATNITAVAFISKEVKTPKHTLLNGFFYTLGRGISYTILAFLMYFGLSSFKVASIFQGWGSKALGPILILIGLVMLNVIKLDFKIHSEKIEQLKLWFSKKGYLGSLFLGILFALAFCPYSGVLFFGILTPMILNLREGILLAPFFALGTGLPVIIFSFIIAFSLQKIGQVFVIVSKIEKIVRISVASIFIIVGLYYLFFFLKYLWGLF